MSITVFSKAGCSQCMFTKRTFEADGVNYKEVRVDENPEMMDYVKDKGVMSLPYVEVVDNDEIISSWSGLRMDKIKGLSA